MPHSGNFYLCCNLERSYAQVGHAVAVVRRPFTSLCALRQKIKEIEDEMARTQKNKATSGHLGMLKVRLCSAALSQHDTLQCDSFGIGTVSKKHKLPQALGSAHIS